MYQYLEQSLHLRLLQPSSFDPRTDTSLQSGLASCNHDSERLSHDHAKALESQQGSWSFRVYQHSLSEDLAGYFLRLPLQIEKRPMDVHLKPKILKCLHIHNAQVESFVVLHVTYFEILMGLTHRS